MNETHPFDTLLSNPIGSGVDQRMPVPDTSMLPGSEQAPPPAIKLLNQAVRGAHDSLDRLAQTVTPAVLQLGETVAAADGVLQAKSEQWRETGDVWVEELRGSVRRNPLACMAAAAVLGAVIVRISR